MTIRNVVFHRPGENWQEGVDFREQDGVVDHVNYYKSLQFDGKLFLGGPFVDGSLGGMMIANDDIEKVELAELAARDPAVKSGLLQFEVKTWYVAMS